MISRLLSLPISGEHSAIRAVDVLHEGAWTFFVADADIDCDGSGGNPDNDPYFQPDTTYHRNGVALDAYVVPFIVVPKIIILAVKGIVLGCRARVTNIVTGAQTDAVVGDVGPSFKLGELSPCAANRIGLHSSPNNGGTDDYNGVLYELWPGIPAVIDGLTYDLQPFS